MKSQKPLSRPSGTLSRKRERDARQKPLSHLWERGRGEGAWWPVLLLALLLLSGCITRPKPPPIPPGDALNNEGARLIWLHRHPEWSFTGRVALRQQGKGGSGRIEWQQHGSRYRIRLSAPVTRQSW